MIYYKSKEEISKIKESGRLLTEIARALKEMIAPGISTLDLEEEAHKLFKNRELEPAFLNYGEPPYPAYLCTSVNEEVVHGIPSRDKILNEGDIISIDLGGIKDNFYSDMAFTVNVGKPDSSLKKLLDVTQKALENGISKMYTNMKLYDISWAIQKTAQAAGFSVVKDLVGHGIGRELHEPPQVPNFGTPDTGMKLKEGLVIALEPMVNMGQENVYTKEDDWTVATSDGQPSCHFEKTVAVTENGPDVLAGL
ncbi:MAG: type I methionyl aminopeptidase [Elusimicrobiota bacterium]